MKTVELPVSVVVEGRRWDLFTVKYLADDRVYEFYIYGISFEHAFHIVEDIKETARLSGQVVEIYNK